MTERQTNTGEAKILEFLAAAKARQQAREPGCPWSEPGVQDQLAAVSAHLDSALEYMVRRIEGVASCQSTDEGAEQRPVQSVVGEAGAPESALVPDEGQDLAAFCDGLATLAEGLFDRLNESYGEACVDAGISADMAAPVLRSRADALATYIVELARVHGVAFDARRPGTPIDDLELHLRRRVEGLVA